MLVFRGDFGAGWSNSSSILGSALTTISPFLRQRTPPLVEAMRSARQAWPSGARSSRLAVSGWGSVPEGLPSLGLNLIIIDFDLNGGRSVWLMVWLTHNLTERGDFVYSACSITQDQGYNPDGCFEANEEIYFSSTSEY